MQTATLIFSFIGAAAGLASLAVVLVGGTRIQQEMDQFKTAAELKRAELKAAFEKLI